jgi:prepilin peptidase CpaA
LAALLPFHIFGWMGAGDVKFFALLGLLLGAKALLPIWAIGSLIAGAHAVVILLSRYWLAHTVPSWMPMQTWLSTPAIGRHMVSARKGRLGLPYAAWLGVGALITAFNPVLMHW